MICFLHKHTRQTHQGFRGTAWTEFLEKFTRQGANSKGHPQIFLLRTQGSQYHFIQGGGHGIFFCGGLLGKYRRNKA